MPSSYIAPDVQVQQIQRTRTAPRLAPQLSAVVVGPARQIAVQEVAGTYEAAEEFQALLPDLASGAVVDPTSIEVILAAEDASGNALGRFRLDMGGVDGEVLSDNETIRLFDTLPLDYSILSSRNNNQVDSLIDDDRATGTPDGIEFTDGDIDFLGRGATLGDDTFIVIDVDVAPCPLG